MDYMSFISTDCQAVLMLTPKRPQTYSHEYYSILAFG
jgi:hypothetical protein